MWLMLATLGCGDETPAPEVSKEETPAPATAPDVAPEPAPEAPPAVPTMVLEPAEPAPPPPPVDPVPAPPAPAPVAAPAPVHAPPPSATVDEPVDEPVAAVEAEPEPEAPADAPPRTWTLDPGASTLYVLVKYDRNTALSGLGHDHTIAATGWSGTVTWDPDDLSACEVEIRVPVGKLVVDPPGYRARAGLEGETPADDKPKILENMWGRKQLEKDRFPEITFRSTACSGDPARPTVQGKLTLHGVTRQVSLPMAIAVDEERFTAEGSLPITGSSFGFDPFTAALGAVKNQDALRIVIDVTGR